ncbi:hypothetical protein [Lysinibacillus sp. K60]|uniref:hypothetical protein n=1 Tax=Lysinibacillus sp. K60 TaxID=2720027 RepID=UPI001C8C0F77|nr:hypothetical protein [Lysinibacillus sp. K60]MBX8946051.1 hypothetical protein [Lysinibacillus sp. K60]
MNQVEAREQYLNFNIQLTEQLFNLKFEGTSLEDKEVFVERYRGRRDAAVDQILSEMHDEYLNRSKEIEKIKKFIQTKPDYKVSDIQRLLMKGYKHCYQLLEEIGER